MKRLFELEVFSNIQNQNKKLKSYSGKCPFQGQWYHSQADLILLDFTFKCNIERRVFPYTYSNVVCMLRWRCTRNRWLSWTPSWAGRRSGQTGSLSTMPSSWRSWRRSALSATGWPSSATRSGRPMRRWRSCRRWELDLDLARGEN